MSYLILTGSHFASVFPTKTSLNPITCTNTIQITPYLITVLKSDQYLGLSDKAESFTYQVESGFILQARV